MATEILAVWTLRPLEVLLISIILVIPLFLIILFFRYVFRSSKDRRRLNQQMKKLTDELQRIQEQMKGDKKGNSSAESG